LSPVFTFIGSRLRRLERLERLERPEKLERLIWVRGGGC